MSETDVKPLLPVVSYLKLPEGGEPYLEGLKCTNCGAVFLDKRVHCASCCQRDALAPSKIASTGKIVAHSVVTRSYPGIQVPFISVVVDMDGGGTVKANLINIEPEPVALTQQVAEGLSVELVFKQAPYGDKKGNEYMMFYFQPKGAAV